MRNLILLLFLLVCVQAIAYSQPANLEVKKDSIQKKINYLTTPSLEDKWQEIKLRSNENWVEYFDDGNARFNVDFSKNHITVQTLVHNSSDIENATQEFPSKIVEVFQNKGTVTGLEFGAATIFEQPLLLDQIQKKPDESNIDAAKRIVQEHTIEKKDIIGKDGQNRIILSLSFSLDPNSIQIRKKTIQEFVYNCSDEFDLSPSIVFAIIHTGSYFNTMAKSSNSAYGLMQIPFSKEHEDEYNKKQNTTTSRLPKLLYIPENNIKLGCAYLSALINKDLKEVTNSLTKQYLAIAAYNAGSQAVFKAYDASENLYRALAKIEAKTPQENYEYLIQNLPNVETREYLKNVVKRTQLYEAWGDY